MAFGFILLTPHIMVKLFDNNAVLEEVISAKLKRNPIAKFIALEKVHLEKDIY